MRRLISTLAAGLLAGGTVLTGGMASASTKAVPQFATCTVTGQNNYFQFSATGANYYIGTPVNPFSGENTFLKPKENSTTLWFGEPCSDGSWLLTQRGLAMTSTSVTAGGTVTAQTAGNGGEGYASQHWFFSFTSSGLAEMRNAKTNLYLRIRNGGPVMGQTLSTGSTPTAWAEPQ